MKTFEVILTKSYVLKIQAESEDEAKRYAELFTGDIQDISTPYYREKFKFEIEEIDCKVNEAVEAKELI